MTKAVANRRDWWSEIKRRGMFHVAGLYLVSAWLLVQIVDVLSQGPLPMPPEALRLVWIALILIFPFVLIFGWRYDITREGVVLTDLREGERQDLPLQPKDHGLIAALGLVVIGIISLTSFEIMTAIEHHQLRAGIGVEEAKAPPPANSIAVLPFTTCSGQESDAILAAGLAGEVIDRLASLKKFKVIARASSFTMAGFGLPLVKIAQPLGVKYLLTGELCRRNGALVLRVELVDEGGYVVWTDDFEQSADDADRLTLTLATQVTEGVATALGQSFNTQAESPVNRLAYEQLVIGREYADQKEFEKAQAAFERALQYDPEYPEALFELAVLVVGKAFEGGDLGYSSIREAEPIAKQAVAMGRRRIAEGQADFNTYFTMGEIVYTTGKWEQWLAWEREGELEPAELADRLDAANELFREAERHARTGLALNPSHVMSYGLLGYILERQGIHRRNEALEVFESALDLDPFNVFMNRQLAKRWAARGRYRQAMELMERFEALPTVPPEALWVRLEISKLQTYWDEKCELLIRMLLNEPAAFEHTGNYGHLVWFPSELAHLGLYEQAEAWYQRVEKIPAEGWAAVLREWFLNEYLEARGNQDDTPDDSPVISGMWADPEDIIGMSDEEILDQNLYDAPWSLAEAGEVDRAIRLAESFQNRAPARNDSTFWAERLAWGEIRLAKLYQWGDRNDRAAELLSEIARGLEAEYEVGVRHPDTLNNLATVYALQGRKDDALDMLRKAVDYHLRWIGTQEWSSFSPWKELEEDPRFIAQRDRMQADLKQQAERIRGMLAQYDIDQLLAPALPFMDQGFAAENQGN